MTYLIEILSIKSFPLSISFIPVNFSQPIILLLNQTLLKEQDTCLAMLKNSQEGNLLVVSAIVEIITEIDQNAVHPWHMLRTHPDNHQLLK